MPVDANNKYIHSAKPEKAFEIIDKLCGDVSRLEMFSRREREDWYCFGDEV